MAAITTLPYTPPVQVLPTYLSYSTYTITTGTPATAIITEAIRLLPQTYYGPSIPLGDDGVWTWGGLTSPTPTPPTTSTTSTRPAGTTATPTSTSSSSTSTSSSGPASSTPSTGATPTISEPTATGSSGPSTTAGPPLGQQGESNISDRVLLIIILVITLFFLLVTGIAVYAWLKRRQQARVAAGSADNASGIQHRGATFRRVLPGIIFNSLYRGSHRHSRLPQDEEAVPPVPTMRQRGHANDSDWDFISPSDRGSLPSVRMVSGPGPGPGGVGVAYRSILPFDEDESDRSHPASASSTLKRHADLQRRPTDATVGSGGGQPPSEKSTRSLFFIDPTLQHGEKADRDPHIFPDLYGRRDHSPSRYDSLPPPPRPRVLPPPIDEEILLPPLLIEQPPLTPRRDSTARASTLLMHPDSSVSDHDEGTTPLLRPMPRTQREPPGTGTAAGGLVSRLSLLLKRWSSAPEPERTTPYAVQDPSMSTAPQMTERKNKLGGFGFLNEPPPPSAWGSRRTNTAAAGDRPISTASGRSNKSTLYHEARSRPESPDAYPDMYPDISLDPRSDDDDYPDLALSPRSDDYPDLAMSPRSEAAPDYEFSGDSDAHEIDVLDQPAPQSLRYPPGLMPTDDIFLTIPDEDIDFDDLEEADIVPDVPISIIGPEYDELEDVPPPATTDWQTMHQGTFPTDDRRATLGESLLLLPPPAAGSRSHSQVGSIGSHSSRHTGDAGESSGGSSHRSRHTRSSVSSAELRRAQDTVSVDQELYVLDDEGMPVTGSGRRLRGGPYNPLPSATFGSPSSWGRRGSRSASGSSRIGTHRSGHSSVSHDRSVSESHRFGRTASQQHLGHGSISSREGSPPPRGLRSAPSFAESGISLEHGSSATGPGQPSYVVVETEPMQSVRYIHHATQLDEESDESERESVPPLRPYRAPPI